MMRKYQVARLTGNQRAERDRLVQQLLDTVRALHEKRLVRQSDLIVDMDVMSPHGETSNKPMDSTFYARNQENDVRISVVLLVQSSDR